jgi:hypothetical protein
MSGPMSLISAPAIRCGIVTAISIVISPPREVPKATKRSIKAWSSSSVTSSTYFSGL